MIGRIESRARRGDWTGTPGSEVVTGITVGTGNNTQALAVPLTGDVNVIGTSSATASTGVRLPAGVNAGDSVAVYNAGASATAIYPQVGGTINALSANAALSLAAGGRALLIATGPARWMAIVSA